MCKNIVSVIIPVYKTEKFLKRCLDSILAQTYRDFEAILIDDGSPDRCGTICDAYAAKDKRLRVIHQTNQGLSAARNAGLNICRGEYIAFVDSDDYVAPEFLQVTIEKLRNARADMVVFNAQYCGPQSGFVGWHWGGRNETSENIKKKLLLGIASFVWLKIYHRDIWKELRFPVGRTFEDLYVNVKVLSNAKKIVSVGDCLYFYERGNASSITSSKSIKNRYDQLCAWSHYWQDISKSTAFQEYAPFCRFEILALWARWSYQCLSLNLFVDVKEGSQELLPDMEMNAELKEAQWSKAWFQTNYYAFYGISNYKKFKVIADFGDYAMPEKLRSMRFILKAFCLNVQTHCLSEGMLETLYRILKEESDLRSRMEIKYQILWLGVIHHINWILYLEGKHLKNEGLRV